MKLLLDACVLYPTVIRNLLISVSGERKWDLIWTEQIFEEWRRASKKINLEAKAQTEAEIAILKSKYPKSMVNDYEKQIPKLYLPDKNDIHVLAAAIEGNANSIVTLNLRDFPNCELKKYGIRGVHPDELLYREALDNFNLIAGFVVSILNDFNKNNANKLSEYRLLKKAKLNRLSKLFR
jgi:predicted nucleic acid-binding protein